MPVKDLCLKYIAPYYMNCKTTFIVADEHEAFYTLVQAVCVW